MINQRRLIHSVLASVLLVAGSAWGQTGRTRKPPTLRAIAVLEWTADGPRLVPITILVDGKYYDASSYLARPVPMALEPETVYELMAAGESEGLFTVTQAKSLPGGAWFGEGQIKTRAELERSKPKVPDTVIVKTEGDSPPPLRRSGSGRRGGGPTSSPTPGPAPGPNPTPAPGPTSTPMPIPTPGPSPSPGPPSSPSPPPSEPPSDGKTNPDDEPPVLKKPADDKSAGNTSAPAPPASSPPVAAEPDAGSDDSGRPILKRGSHPGGEPQALGKVPSAKQQAAKPQQRSIAKDQASAKKSTPPQGLKPVMVAVSDVRTTVPHPYTWVWNENEKPRLIKEVQAMALAEVNAYARQHPGIVPAARLEDLEIHAFDLNYSNEARLVLTARVPQGTPPATRPGSRGKTGTAGQAQPAPPSPSPFSKPVDTYVTLVARQNLRGELRKVFSSVTDSRRLDLTPRLELVDAVDPDGSGPGALLFRQISDRGSSYILYRVSLDAMTPLFDGAAPES